MSEQTASRISLAELEKALKAADPAAFLLRPRVLRRIIKHERRLTGLGLQVPHPRSYVIDRDSLLRIIDRAELGLGPDAELPPTVILLARPDPERLANVPTPEVLFRYWRLLFHAHVHIALERRRADGRLSPAAVRGRVHALGKTEFEEIRAVLRHENFLLAPRDDAQVYTEFAAVYLELRLFAAGYLPRYFPSLHPYEAVDKVLAVDLDAAGLFAATRLAGAPDPVTTADFAPEEGGLDAPDAGAEPLAPGRPSEGEYRRQLRKADRAAAVGNVVRSALRKTRAARAAAPAAVEETRAAARAEVDRLVGRLRDALKLTDAEAEAWSKALPALLEPASRGIWPVEARLLYDLQKVCTDHERQRYALDLVEWALSLGRVPVKRPLPGLREVLIVKHLRSASRRLLAARLPEAERRQLSELLREAVHHSEERLRDRFRPLVAGALAEVGMKPQNYPEQVALNKLTEELLDRISDHGFLNMGHLRDALSRNQLKLPDLAGVGEFLHGDRLLLLDRKLAVALDGVYHRGEIYLRGLQRLSSLAFGTRVGRFLTRYVALPFGGAFVVLEGLQHLVGPLVAHATGEHVHLMTPVTVGLLGVFLLGLLHVAPFRRGVGKALGLVFRGLRGLFFDLPAAVLRLPVVRKVLDGRPFLFLYRYGFKPLLVTALIWLACWSLSLVPQADELGEDPPVVLEFLAGLGEAARRVMTLAGTGVVFVVVLLLLNSRPGREAEEVVTDWGVRGWHRFSGEILPGLFRLIMGLFKRVLEDVERLLYAVDEWLRFQSGESRLTQAVKAVLGLVWFFATYLIRIYVNLLIEPTVNPIKHFPVVTVSHKIMVPLIPFVFSFLAALMSPFGPGVAYSFAAVTIFFLPGIFGFLVWELKENWRLYRANRAAALRPVLIGGHGETMTRLLRPGFHSGTLPKLFAKLRRAERIAYRAGGKAARKHREALHHVEESLRRFVEREFLVLLNGSKSWGGAEVTCGEISLGSNRIRIDLDCPALGERPLVIAFEEHAGWLVALVARPGWLEELSPAQRGALTTALAGLYKLAGVDLVREQVEAGLGGGPLAYVLGAEGLVVWATDGSEAEAVYNLRNGPTLHPRILVGAFPVDLPALASAPLLYRQVVVTWERWVEAWEQDQAGKGPPDLLPEGVRLLPRPAPAPVA
jgi:hypothetical protein